MHRLLMIYQGVPWPVHQRMKKEAKSAQAGTAKQRLKLESDSLIEPRQLGLRRSKSIVMAIDITDVLGRWPMQLVKVV
jgi:hypothetical protein